MTRRDDGSLDWAGEALPGEAGLVADCQAFVDAGLAEWDDGDGSRLLDNDELHELGVLPLGDLHRRRERGEL